MTTATDRVVEARTSSLAGRLAPMIWRQFVLELKLFWRNRASFFFGFLLPLLLLLFFGALNDGSTVQGHAYIDFFLPGMLGFTVIATALSNLAIGLPILRDRLILKRLRATPLPTSVFLAGKLLLAAVVIVLESAVMLAVGKLLFGLHLPRDLASLFLLLAIGAVVFSAIGFAVAGLIPNGDAASAIVNAIYLPMVLLGGAFFPVNGLPGFLKAIGAVLPLTHFITLLRGLFLDGQGLAAHPRALLVLAAWFAISALVALRTFRWVA